MNSCSNATAPAHIGPGQASGHSDTVALGGPGICAHSTPCAPGMSTSTFCRADGRVVAELRGDTLSCRRRSSRDVWRYPLAWAVDSGILAMATQIGVAFAEIVDLDTGNVYRAMLEDFRRHGCAVGDQVALAWPMWSLLRLGEVRPGDVGLRWE